MIDNWLKEIKELYKRIEVSIVDFSGAAVPGTRWPILCDDAWTGSVMVAGENFARRLGKYSSNSGSLHGVVKPDFLRQVVGSVSESRLRRRIMVMSNRAAMSA